jgi:hypothetical protein
MQVYRKEHGLPGSQITSITEDVGHNFWIGTFGDGLGHECMRVTGTIVLKRPEKDGDIHIQLKLDKQFLPLLDAENKSRQGGNLVLEPICVGPVTQADAIQPCQGLTNQVSIPKKGDHVAVTGTFVHDVEGGHGWMEIHPVTLDEPN